MILIIMLLYMHALVQDILDYNKAINHMDHLVIYDDDKLNLIWI